MPIWLTWYSPLEFDYVALLQLRYCLFFVAQNMTVESKHHHGGTPFQILFSLPIWGRDWIGEIPEKIETSWLCSSQGLLSLLIKESSAHHHSFHFLKKIHKPPAVVGVVKPLCLFCLPNWPVSMRASKGGDRLLSFWKRSHRFVDRNFQIQSAPGMYHSEISLFSLEKW